MMQEILSRDLFFCSDNLHDHWDELDEFEGEGYKRISAKVQKNNKSTTEAQIYVLRDSLQPWR